MSELDYKYQFVRLHLEQFATLEENFDASKDATIKIDNFFQFAFNNELKAVCCATNVSYVCDGKVLLKAVLKNYFLLHDDTVAKLIKDDYLTLPTILLAEFASLSYGSLRGVLYTKTESTPLEKIVLPPAHFNNVFDKDLKLKIQ